VAHTRRVVGFLVFLAIIMNFVICFDFGSFSSHSISLSSFCCCIAVVGHVSIMNTSMARVGRDLKEVNASIRDTSAPPIFAFPVNNALHELHALV
jgi:hypothetical protein